MNEYAPAAIFQLYKAIHDAFPGAELSGILGDRAHTYGYHRARNVLPAGDYSVVLPWDKEGDGWAASALDVKLPADKMKLCSARLREALRVKDPRVRALREFGGTLNGTVTFSRDKFDHESFGEWDNTHLWHIHLSITRKFSNDWNAIKGIADVMAGKPMPVPAKVVSSVTPTPAPKWTLPAGHYYGLITGPDQCHGGYYLSERSAIKLIQQRLQALGHAPKTAGWADGIFEQPTKDAVIRWQRARKRRATGVVTKDDWTALFSQKVVTA